MPDDEPDQRPSRALERARPLALVRAEDDEDEPGDPDPDDGDDSAGEEEPDGKGAAVAVAAGSRLPALREPGERIPIVPDHLRRANIGKTVAEFIGVNAYRAGFHAPRSPLYLLAALFWGLAGLLRAVGVVAMWVRVIPGRQLEREAADANDAREYAKLHKLNNETRDWRLRITGVLLGILLVGVYVFYRLGRPWEWITAGALLVLLLSRLGRPEGLKIVATAVVPPKYEVPTPEIIRQALCELPIAKIEKHVREKGDLEWVSDVHRDGDGWAVELDLPKGVTAKKIIELRAELSSSLRRPLSATWPEPVPHEHEGRMYLWIGRHDMSKVAPPAYPLLKTGTTDYFGKVPFAANPRAVPVTVPLFQANILLGAAPGEGKTNSLRVLGLDAALDPVCDLWVHEFSGKGDLRILAQVSHRYCSGLDDEALAYAAESISMLRDELERRSAIFKKLPDSAKPDGALTRELAEDPSLRLRPVVVILDEVQNLFLSPYGAEAAATLAHVGRLARAYGITLLFATQRPDKDCLPTAIGGIVQLRFCLKVADQVANDMVLGTGAYKAGFNAVLFRHEIDAGLGWLRGAGDPQPIRTHYLNLKDAGKVAARARQLRDRAGVLSGYAIGEDSAPMPRDVLADVRVVLGSDNGIQWPDLAERLAQRWPDRWAAVTAESISAQCRALGVRSVDVRSNGVVLKGCRRQAVDEAARR